MAKVKFTRDIIGSPNGIIVKEYKAEQVVSDAELGNYLLEVWKEAGIIVEVDVDVDVDNKDADVDNSGKDADGNADDNGETGDKDVDNGELTEEKIGDLVYEANEILEKDGKLTDEDIAKLKEIGIELKIDGMQSSKKPQTILDKINAYIDEYNGEEDENGEDEDEIPEQ